MTSPTQREALAVVAEICELAPDIRLGQLFSWLGFVGEDQTGRSLWDIDDEQLLTILYHHRGELVDRQSALRDQTTRPSASGGSVPENAPSSGTVPAS